MSQIFDQRAVRVGLLSVTAAVMTVLFTGVAALDVGRPSESLVDTHGRVIARHYGSASVQGWISGICALLCLAALGLGLWAHLRRRESVAIVTFLGAVLLALVASPGLVVPVLVFAIVAVLLLRTGAQPPSRSGQSQARER